MFPTLWLFFAAAAIAILIFLPSKWEIGDLPKLFSDEPAGIIEKRPDLAAKRGADETYQFRTMRTAITCSLQRNGGVLTERFEITYRGKPGPIIDLDDGVPVSWVHGGQRKVYFLPREIRDIQAFAHHLRSCRDNYCAST